MPPLFFSSSRRCRTYTTLSLVLIFACVVTAAQSADPFHSTIERVAKTPGIGSLMLCPWEREAPPLRSSDRLILIIVDARLLPLVDAPVFDDGAVSQPHVSAFTVWNLSPVLEQWRGDLADAGYAPRFVRLQLNGGARSILTLRSLIGGVRAAFPGMIGVILVGNFPQATIVRRWIGRGTTADGAAALRIFPQTITTRGDIVLADFDTAWEKFWIEGSRSVPTLEMVPVNPPGNWPQTGQVLESTSFSFGNTSVRDCFYVQDDTYVAPVGFDKPKLKLKIDLSRKNPDVGGSDRSGLNPIARPDMVISRIDARTVATGEGGQPDFVLERRLLVEYFERLHELRVAKRRQGDTAIISAPADGRGIADRRVRGDLPLHCTDATLVDLLRWLELPAGLRVIDAPLDGAGWRFGSAYQKSTLSTMLGGDVPASATGRFDLPMMHALWRNSGIPSQGSIYLPLRGATASLAEGLLFFLEGYSVLAISTAEGEQWQPVEADSLGAALLALYARETGRSPSPTAADTKRAYGWFVLGDWTCPLP